MKSVLVAIVIVCFLSQFGVLQECDPALAKEVTSYGQGGAVPLYSRSNIPCLNQPTGSTSLKCSGTYTSYTFAAQLVNENRSSGVCSSSTLYKLAPNPGSCYQYFNSADLGQQTTYITEIRFTTAFLKPIIYYEFADTGITLPFTYMQASGMRSDTRCSVYPNCSSAKIVEYLTTGGTCPASSAFSLYGDTSNTSEVASKCGSLSDPVGPILPSSTCRELCCASCNGVNETSFRRYGVGPLCKLVKLRKGQWSVLGGIRASIIGSGEYSNVTFQKLSVNSQGISSFDFGAMGPTQEFVSQNKKMRVTFDVGAVDYGSVMKNGDYLIVCDLDPKKPEDQGPANPYAINKITPPCYSSFFLPVELIPQIVNPDATPQGRGAGSVPTDLGQGGGSKFSFFYVDKSRVASLVAKYANQVQPFANDFTSILYSGATSTAEGTTCPGGPSDFFTKYRNVPGWNINETSGKPFVTSVCQMSSEINTYRNCFLTNWVAPFDEAGALSAKIACAPLFPAYLYPDYDITSPATWVTQNSLIHVPSVGKGSGITITYSVDLADDTFKLGVENPVGFSLSNSYCVAVPNSPPGLMSFFVSNPSTKSGTALVDVRCNTVTNGTVDIVAEGSTTFLVNVSIPVPGLGEVVSPQYSLLYSAQSNANGTYVVCSQQLINNRGEYYGTRQYFECINRGDPFVTILNEMEFTPQNTAPIISKTLTIILCVTGGVVLIIVAIILIIVCACAGKKKSKEKQK